VVGKIYRAWFNRGEILVGVEVIALSLLAPRNYVTVGHYSIAKYQSFLVYVLNQPSLHFKMVIKVFCYDYLWITVYS
jgi:hypothetical protein